MSAPNYESLNNYQVILTILVVTKALTSEKKGKCRFPYNSGQRVNVPNSGSRIFGTPKPYQYSCPEHHVCNKRGHVAAYYFQRYNNSTTGIIFQCQICWKFGHLATQCYHRNNFAYKGKPHLLISLQCMLIIIQLHHLRNIGLQILVQHLMTHMTYEVANLDLATTY